VAPRSAIAKLGEKPEPNEEFPPETVDVDLLAEMLANADDEDSAEDDDAEAEQLLKMEDGGQNNDDEGEKETQRRDYKVDVYLFGHAVTYYSTALETMGGGTGTEVVVILTDTAHPASWYAARSLCSHVEVLLERSSDHSVSHGEAWEASANVGQIFVKFEITSW